MVERMEVDTEHLRAGADRCSDAAGMALATAAKLAETRPAVGMFGDFEAAHDFDDAISAAHAHHVAKFEGHHSALSRIGAQSLSAADEFTMRDVSNADTLQAAEAGFDGL